MFAITFVWIIFLMYSMVEGNYRREVLSYNLFHRFIIRYALTEELQVCNFYLAVIFLYWKDFNYFFSSSKIYFCYRLQSKWKRTHADTHRRKQTCTKTRTKKLLHVSIFTVYLTSVCKLKAWANMSRVSKAKPKPIMHLTLV